MSASGARDAAVHFLINLKAIYRHPLNRDKRRKFHRIRSEGLEGGNTEELNGQDPQGGKTEDLKVPQLILKGAEFEQIVKDALIELATLDGDLLQLKPIADALPVCDGVRRDRAANAWARLFNSIECPYSHLIFVPWLKRGGADLVAAHATHAAIEKFGLDKVLVIVTDDNSAEATDWLPDNCHVKILSELELELTSEERAEIVAWLIQALRPKAALNVNSLATWMVMKRMSLPLSQVSNLFATLFCHDYNSDGDRLGYANLFLRDAIDSLTKIYFDNEKFKSEIMCQYALPPSIQAKLQLSYQPHPKLSRFREAHRGVGGELTILWAGRLCRQKNPGLLSRIALLDNSLNYEVFGAIENSDPEAQSFIEAAEKITNLTIRGAYSSFDELPLQRSGAFLYTTLWDGMPNVLLAAGAAGLPVVAPDVGGIGELIDDTTGWLVKEVDNPNEYLKALHHIRDDPVEAKKRVAALTRRLLDRHNWSSYVRSISGFQSFLG
jgi:glycosyltransferase involved in cell wall biosynthesis